MPLDGLRAWIGEVERKLGMRTRVFLALAAIAIGGAGAAIYLAIDTRDNAVSESDVQALQEKLEARMGTGAAVGGADLTQLEAEVDSLRTEVEELNGDGGKGATGSKGSDDGSGDSPGGLGLGLGSGSDGGSDTGASGPTGATGEIPSGGAGGLNAKELSELLERAKKQSEKVEREEEEGKR